MDADARLNAQKQWNTTACGSTVEGLDDQSLDYFLALESARYAEQPWAHEYFDYASFSGKRVLEIGVGQGTDLVQFARAGAECHAIDITDNHLDRARRNLELRGLSANIQKADATALPFPDNHFDAIYSFGVVHHIPEIGRVIAEARRALKPGGTLMLAVYNKWSAFHVCWKLLCHGIWKGELWKKGYDGLLATIEAGADGVEIKPYVRLYSTKEVRGLLRGFEVRDVSVHQLTEGSFWPSRLGKVLRNHVDRLEGTLGWYVAARATKR